MTASLDQVTWPATADRVSLRRLTEDDLARTWKYRKLPEVTQWITSAPQDFETYRAQFIESGKINRDIAVEISGPGGESQLIGTIMVFIKDAWGQREILDRTQAVEAELGWSFDPQFTGQGYATEAVRRAMKLCFEELGLRRIVAGCFAANEPSARLMERVGMRREAFEKSNSLHRSGEWMDSYSYAMLRDEWVAKP